jgi:hypothetical protein
MILMPLDCDTMILLHDPKTYSLRHDIIDVMHRSDVSQLNSLQIYAPRNGVYFSDVRDVEYVSELVATHRVLCKESYSELRVHPAGTLLVDGKPSDREMMHTFESQLPIRLDLSFMTTSEAPADDGPHRPRSPEIKAMLKEMEQKFEGAVSTKAMLKEMLGDIVNDFVDDDNSDLRRQNGPEG